MLVMKCSWILFITWPGQAIQPRLSMTDVWWFNRLSSFSLPRQDRGVWRSSKEPEQWYSYKGSKTATRCNSVTRLKWVCTVVESRKRWKSWHTNACLLVCDCIRKVQPLPGPSALSKCAPNTYNLEMEEWPAGCGLLTIHFYFCLTDGLNERTVLSFFCSFHTFTTSITI